MHIWCIHVVSNKCGIREHSVLWAYLKCHQGNRKTFLHFSFKGYCHEMWICICNSENILTISSFFVDNKFVSAGNCQWLPFVWNKDRKRLQIEKLSSSLFELIIVSSFENYPVGVAVAPFLKGLVHDNAHARRLSLQNKFVGSTINSKSPLPVQSLKILRFIRTSVALAGLVILR